MAEPLVAVAARATLGEGPVWDERAEILYWVDILGKSVHAYDPATGADRLFDVGAHAGSLALRTDGHLLVAAVDRLLDLDPADGALTEVAAVPHPGPAARFNDGKCDPAGRFWVGTMGYDQVPGSAVLYRVDPDLSVHRVLTGVTVSNGLDFPPDGRTLYYTDTPTGRIDAFDVHPDDGVLSGRRTVVEIPAAAGYPDGLTLDADGALWVALWGGSAVHRYTPDGRLDRVIPFPVPRPTCPVFGGTELRTLYVTSARVGTEDALSGALFTVDTGAQGLAPHRFGA